MGVKNKGSTRSKKVGLTTKLVCTACGKEKVMSSAFYVSYSMMYKYNEGRMPVCKDCFYNRYKELLVEYKGDEIKALYHICMQFDIYFDTKLFEKSQENIKNDDLSMIKTYMKNVNSLRQNKGKGSLESIHVFLGDEALDEKIEESKPIEVYEDVDYDSLKIPTHIKKKWGSGYSNEEYIYLEDNYAEFYDAYSHETPAERMLLMNISRALLEAERSRKKGKTKDYENMMKLVSSMLTDANIKPSQKKTKGDEIGECFGVFIENIEKYEPIGEAIDEFEDVDNIGKLIDRQFVKNFAKIFGLRDDDENEN